MGHYKIFCPLKVYICPQTLFSSHFVVGVSSALPRSLVHGWYQQCLPRTQSCGLACYPGLVQWMHTNGWNQPTCSLATNVVLGMPSLLQGPPITEVPERDANTSERGVACFQRKMWLTHSQMENIETLRGALWCTMWACLFFASPSWELEIIEYMSKVGRKGGLCSPNLKIPWESFLWNLPASLQFFQLNSSKQNCNKFIYSYNYWRRSYWVAMTVTKMGVDSVFMTLAFPWGTGQRTRSNNTGEFW